MKAENIGLISVLFLMAIIFSPLEGHNYIPHLFGGFLLTGFIWLWKK